MQVIIIIHQSIALQNRDTWCVMSDQHDEPTVCQHVNRTASILMSALTKCHWPVLKVSEQTYFVTLNAGYEQSVVSQQVNAFCRLRDDRKQ
jgi:hypothetical protein